VQHLLVVPEPLDNGGIEDSFVELAARPVHVVDAGRDGGVEPGIPDGAEEAEVEDSDGRVGVIDQDVRGDEVPVDQCGSRGRQLQQR
jgi:hypothetical protein